MGFAAQLSTLNAILLWDMQRNWCRCASNLISIQDWKRFARGKKRVATCLAQCVVPAWRGFGYGECVWWEHWAQSLPDARAVVGLASLSSWHI